MVDRNGAVEIVTSEVAQPPRTWEGIDFTDEAVYPARAAAFMRISPAAVIPSPALPPINILARLLTDDIDIEYSVADLLYRFTILNTNDCRRSSFQTAGSKPVAEHFGRKFAARKIITARR